MSTSTVEAEKTMETWRHLSTPVMDVFISLRDVCTTFLKLTEPDIEDDAYLMAGFNAMKKYIEDTSCVLNFFDAAVRRFDNDAENTRTFCEWVVNYDFSVPLPVSEPLSDVDMGLSDQVEALNAKVKELTAQAEEDARETLRFMEIAQDLGKYEDKCKDLELDLEASEDKVEVLLAQNSELCDNIARVAEDKDDAVEMGNYYADENQELRNENQVLKRTRDGLLDELTDLVRKYETLERENARLKRVKLPVPGSGTHIIHNMGTKDQRTVAIVEQEFTDAQPEETFEGTAPSDDEA